MHNTDTLRIAMLGHKHIPSREGGVEIVVEELSTRMVKKGCRVTCYNRNGNHVSGKKFNQEKIKEYKGVIIKNVFTINKKGLAAMTSSFVAACRAAFGNYNIVHFHAEGPCAMLWFPKLLGKHCIATIHGLDHQREKWGWLARNYIKSGEKTAVRYADEIIVLSANIQEYFQKNYGRSTKLIPNGVTRPVLQKADCIRTQFNLKKDDYILYLGRIVPEKGLRYLVQAFQQVETTKKLVIAGGSSDTASYFKELQQMAAEDHRILFTDFVQGRLLEELYSNAYVYVLPSDLEGMPLSLLEAMSYGNCCLVSDIPECLEVVEDKAATFKAGDIQDLKRQLQLLCDNKELVNHYKMIASSFICGKYNWEDTTEKTLKLYKHLGDSSDEYTNS